VSQVHIVKVSEVFIEELKLKCTRHAIAPDESIGSCVKLYHDSRVCNNLWAITRRSKCQHGTNSSPVIPCTTILCTSGSIRVVRQERGSTGKETKCASPKERSQQEEPGFRTEVLQVLHALVLWSHLYTKWSCRGYAIPSCYRVDTCGIHYLYPYMHKSNLITY
jgi:hypothetical protein